MDARVLPRTPFCRRLPDSRSRWTRFAGNPISAGNMGHAQLGQPEHGPKTGAQNTAQHEIIRAGLARPEERAGPCLESRPVVPPTRPARAGRAWAGPARNGPSKAPAAALIPHRTPHSFPIATRQPPHSFPIARLAQSLRLAREPNPSRHSPTLSISCLSVHRSPPIPASDFAGGPWSRAVARAEIDAVEHGG